MPHPGHPPLSFHASKRRPHQEQRSGQGKVTMPQSKSSPAELETGPLLRVLPRERAVVLRATIANVDKHWVAERAQAAGLAGTVAGGALGFGDWGIEGSVVVECATRDPGAFIRFVAALLQEVQEEMAYLTEDGNAAKLLRPDGRVLPL
jgi:hypothetical protein